MATINRGYPELPANVNPDVPHYVNLALRRIDADVQILEIQNRTEHSTTRAELKKLDAGMTSGVRELVEATRRLDAVSGDAKAARADAEGAKLSAEQAKNLAQANDAGFAAALASGKLTAPALLAVIEAKMERPLVAAHEHAYYPARLVDPAKVNNYMVRGLQGNLMFVQDRSTQGTPQEWLRLSYDGGQTFTDNLFWPDKTDAGGPAVWADGYLYACFKESALNRYAVYRTPMERPTANLMNDQQAVPGLQVRFVAGPNATLSTTIEWAPDGFERSLRVANVGAGDIKFGSAYNQNSGMVPVTPGSFYTASTIVHSPLLSRQVRVELQWYDAAKKYIQAVNGDFVATGTGEKTVSAAGTAPAAARYAALAVTMQGAEERPEVHYFAKFGIMQDTAAWGRGKWRWTQVQFLSPGASSMTATTVLGTDGTNVWCGDPGDPVNDKSGPSIFTFDGTKWAQSWLGDNRWRHIHAVIADPYNPGHVYASLGDGTVPYRYLKSTDSGRTWAAFGAPGVPQGVQLSFDKDWIWVAPDGAAGQPPFVMSRDGARWKFAATNSPRSFAIPGGQPGYRFSDNAIYGAIDPKTGVYHMNTSGAGGTGGNVGYFVLPKLGGRLELISTDVFNEASQGQVFIRDTDGEVFFANHRHAAFPVVSI